MVEVNSRVGLESASSPMKQVVVSPQVESWQRARVMSSEYTTARAPWKRCAESRAAGTSLLVLALLGLLGACGGRECIDMPDELQGTWTTSHPLYESRSLEIRLLELAFGVGENAISRHPVVCVEVDEPSSHPFGTPYRIIYLTADDAEIFMPVQVDAELGELRLTNRSQASWTRRRDRDAS